MANDLTPETVRSQTTARRETGMEYTLGIYRHATSGDLYAASISNEGETVVDVRVVGPLYYADVIAPSDEYEFEPEDPEFADDLVFVCLISDAVGKTAEEVRFA